MKKIILASTSPRRKELLAKTGLTFEVMPSSYEEDMNLNLPPMDLAKHLSLGKAEAVASENPDSVVIGADTFIAFEDKVLGKPHTPEKAKEMLNMLSGKQHSVITGFAIVEKQSGQVVSRAVECKVFFRNLSEEEIDTYIATGEPIDRAGAYAIQGEGGKLVDHFEGDFDTIVGLPVQDVLKELQKFNL